MRFNRSFVSGFLATSGDFGPSPPPCFGSHGAGAGGFCVLSGMLNITDLRARTQLIRKKGWERELKKNGLSGIQVAQEREPYRRYLWSTSGQGSRSRRSANPTDDICGQRVVRDPGRAGARTLPTIFVVNGW
jgi:hypothetical protein